MLQEDQSAGFQADAPLVGVSRGAIIESLHRGRMVFCGPEGVVLDEIGDPEGYVYPRSSAKPFQALPLVLSGAADEFGLTTKELAVACGSHNGEEIHLDAVRSILKKAGLSEEDLQSGAHPPLYAPAAEKLVRSGEKPSSIDGNCSGKHAGMLAVCAHEGWDLESYRRPDHPLQLWILDLLSQTCGPKRDEILVAGDNCGVPTFALSLRSLATGFARLATGEHLSSELSEAVRRIRDAMREHPYMVAGAGRFDTDLMQKTNLVVKGGAEAVFTAGSPEGWGVAIKVSDGANRAVKPAALAALTRHGVDIPEEATSSETFNLHGEPIGEIEVLF